MSAAQLGVTQLAGVAAPVLAGLLLRHFSVEQVYGWLGLGFAASSVLLLPGLGPFLRLDHESVRGWYARQHPEAFGLPREREPMAGS